jgi:hypothetical protein
VPQGWRGERQARHLIEADRYQAKAFRMGLNHGEADQTITLRSQLRAPDKLTVDSLLQMVHVHLSPSDIHALSDIKGGQTQNEEKIYQP